MSDALAQLEDTWLDWLHAQDAVAPDAATATPLSAALQALDVATKGGPGSGFFGHSGRPGYVGGSARGSGRGSPAGADRSAAEINRWAKIVTENVGTTPGETGRNSLSRYVGSLLLGMQPGEKPDAFFQRKGLTAFIKWSDDQLKHPSAAVLQREADDARKLADQRIAAAHEATAALDKLRAEQGPLVTDVLAGRASATIGEVTGHDGTKFKLALVKDTSEAGVYSARVTGPDGKSSSIRMKFEGNKPLAQVAERLQSYWDSDGPSGVKIELSAPKTGGATPASSGAPAAPKPPREKTSVDEWKAQLKHIEGKRYKTHGDEVSAALLTRRLAADPRKWAAGHGVGWRATSDQINRGFRIIATDAANKHVKLRQVADTGLTSSGGDNDRIADFWVPMGDVLRDKRYDG